MQIAEHLWLKYQDYLWKKLTGLKFRLLVGFIVLILIALLGLIFEIRDKYSNLANESYENKAKAFGGVIFWLFVSIGALYSTLKKYRKSKEDIYYLVQEFAGGRTLFTHARMMPKYRFPDLFCFLKSIAGGSDSWLMLKSQHYESLQGIIVNNFFAPQNRRINAAEIKSWKVGHGRKEPIPQDVWLIIPESIDQACLIIRIRMDSQMNWSFLEVAAKDDQIALAWLDKVDEYFRNSSIYKRQTVQFGVNISLVEVYGTPERSSQVFLDILDIPAVTDSDIILDHEIQVILERCVVDFHNRREELIRHGLSGRRGVIFYGPPGTGKTYTCRYLSGKMKDITTIVVAGNALTYPKQFCALAKTMQPALVLLEDVDLVYGSRDRNFNVSALGDLMDELDGFGQTDKVIFILTTNSIDRVEEAIKDRPGRISQCVYFGQPDAGLRERYLKSLLVPYHSEAVSLELVIAETEGASQAFLKELIYRAVQIASDGSISPDDGKVVIRDAHLNEALSQIRKNSGKSGATILGFRA